MAKILVIRFSAIGDIAMTIPVIQSFVTQYPEHEIVFLSRPTLEPVFRLLPGNVTFYAAELNGKHKGITGLFRLFRELRKLKIDYVADLHDVMRSQLLRIWFKLSGVATAKIDKGRSGKRKLVRRKNKVFVNQKSSFRRYTEVFEKLGFPLILNFNSIYGEGKGDLSAIENITGKKQDKLWLGIAPFAKHKGKIYPLELQEQVVAHFSNDPRVQVFLFGGGKHEEMVFNKWMKSYPTLISVAGKLNMDQELNLMSHLDVMLSMDSANMHLASLVNTPVVSVWGATHPYAGFLGWMQLPTNCVQTELSCRPCSVFGDKPCYRHDYACMNLITPQDIIQKIESLLN